MRKIIRLVIFVLLLVILPAFSSLAYNSLPPSAATLPASPNLNAKSAILIDAATQTILFEKNAESRLEPASLTKVLTALVTVDFYQDLTQLLTVSQNAVSLPADATRMNVQAGDKLSVLDCLYGLMLPSGNDAAIVLAESIAGSIEAFAARMNEKAAQLGLASSNFVNPHGLHNEDHYTTARDYGLLCQAFVQNTQLLSICSTYRRTVTIYRGEQTTQFDVTNTNDMLNPSNSSYNNSVKGIKTGYTSQAGNCLATYMDKEGRRLICVVFGCADGYRFSDSDKLLAYGFTQFNTLNLTDVFTQKKRIVSVENSSKDDEYNGQLDAVLLSNEPVLYTTTTQMAAAILSGLDPLVTEIPADIKAPVYVGDELGTVTYRLGSEVIYTGKVFAGRTVLGTNNNKNQLIPIEGINEQNPVLSFMTNPLLLSVFFGSLVLAVFIWFAHRARQERRTRIARRRSYIMGRSRYR